MQVLFPWASQCLYWEEDIHAVFLGKNKYGGPFTNEEVEDTKTFLRILPLLLCLFGYHLADGYSASGQLQRTSCSTATGCDQSVHYCCSGWNTTESGDVKVFPQNVGSLALFYATIVGSKISDEIHVTLITNSTIDGEPYKNLTGSTDCENEYTIGPFQATIPGQIDICQMTHEWIEQEQ